MTTPPHSQRESTRHGEPESAPTEAERNFFANHWHETLALTRGPAIAWLVQNGIQTAEIYPFTTLLQKEHGLVPGPPKPDHCVIPWATVEEFRARSRELAAGNATTRTIAIGDIHGCSTALNRLIAAIEPGEQDTLVVLGDVLDWGPDSRGVIERLLRLSEQCRLIPLLGNHEEMLLAARESRSELGYWLKFGGDATLNSYGLKGTLDGFPASHLNFIKSCRLWHETDDFLFVHANYDHRLPMERQSGTRLRWEHLDPAEAKPHVSGKTAIVGHTPQSSGQVLDLGCLVCLDTGCCEGGWLSALDVTTGRIWQTNQEGELRELKRELRESRACS